MDQFQKSDDISERVGLPIQTVRSFLRQIIAGVSSESIRSNLFMLRALSH